MESIDYLHLALGRYLGKKRFEPPQWAVNDCNTFVVEWHDQWYQTDHYNMCGFEYDGPVSAARWQKNFYPAPEFLNMIGYQQVMLSGTGDILLQNLGPFWCAWIVFDRHAYSIDHELGLVKLPVTQIENYTIWSKDA